MGAEEEIIGGYLPGTISLVEWVSIVLILLLVVGVVIWRLPTLTDFFPGAAATRAIWLGRCHGGHAS